MTVLRVLDPGSADAVERLCELIVPGSGRAGPVVYVDAVLAEMPPPVREQGTEALAEHERTDEGELRRALAVEAFYSDFVAPGAEGPGAWAAIDFNTPLARRLAKDWSYLGIA